MEDDLDERRPQLKNHFYLTIWSSSCTELGTARPSFFGLISDEPIPFNFINAAIFVFLTNQRAVRDRIIENYLEKKEE